MPLLITDCPTLLGSAATGHRVETCDLLIRGALFEAIAPGGTHATEAGWQVIDGRRRLAVPGLINAHTHSPLNVLRGTTDGMDHARFMWTNQDDTAGRGEEQIHASAALGALDMLRNGVTAIVDQYPEQNCRIEDIPPVVRAYTDVGIRAVLALRVFDGGYDDIGRSTSTATGQDTLAPRPADELIAICAEAVERWHGADGLISIYPGPSNPIRCTDALLVGCHDLAERHDLGLHTHLLETRVQQEMAARAYGKTMVAHLDDLGILTHRWSFAHGVWTTDEDIELLAERRSVVVHNPHSNAKLGVGVAPIAAMRAAGVPVALGTDGASTNDTLSVHETMALAALLPRITGTDRGAWLDAGDVLDMATAGGALVMGSHAALGEIAVGKTADLALYDLDSLTLAPLNDAVQQLVFAERGRSVRTTIVNGKVVYADGEFPGRNVDELLRVAREIRTPKH